MPTELAEGAVVLVRFDPAFGHEQAGTRPALVVSRRDYNEHSSFVLVCPITSNSRPWPFKIQLPERNHIHGFVLADQIKSVDRRRIVRAVDTVAADVLANVLGLIDLVLATSDPEP
jgi:mRNA interferase MazF